MNKELWTIGRILQWTEQYFRGKGIESSRLDGEVLLSHILEKDRLYLYANYDRPLDESELNAFRPLVIERAKGMSVASIIGKKEFMGLVFQVNEHVLIPRPDTETLVEAVLSELEQKGDWRILDMCTGPGTILFSLLHYMKAAIGVGLDVSKEALEVAKRNQASLGLLERSELMESDLFSALEGNEAFKEYFDVLVSNPPYIETDVVKTLAKEVLNEPHIALDGGIDGLDFYRRILEEGHAFVRPQGYVFVEIGEGQESAVSSIAAKAGHYGEPRYIKDINGIIRVIGWERL